MSDHSLGDSTKKHLVTVELFCGTKSFSKVAAEHGHRTFTVDNDPRHEPDLCIDIMQMSLQDIPEEFRHPDVVWASVPCTYFSKAHQWVNWEKVGTIYHPRTENARQACALVQHTLELIRALNPRIYFIENPMGMLRLMPFMRGIGKMRTTTYCKYGTRWRKQTDIWTNQYVWKPRKPCHLGDNCHAHDSSARSGMDVRDPIRRAIVPKALCEEIVTACEVTV